MTTQMKTGENEIASEFNEIDVTTYLRRHPEFFLNHPELLVELEVPHPAGGAVSLIERQVALIRQENKLHRERIRELVEIARDNENIVEKLHKLNVKLIASKTLDDYIENMKQQLCDNFSANHVSMVFFIERFAEVDDKSEFVSTAEKELNNFAKFLANKESLCGRFNSDQLTFLFADKADEVKSMALIPLLDGEVVGMLAIGSANADHFKADMSTLFLTSLGDVSSAVLKHYLN
jgi:uncharacterized protein YigA (DUF484 family)